MEGHEVPKNVSEFEFHLIGDMTVKQFAYLGTGLGVAYLLFAVLSSSAPILAWPLIVIFSLTGIVYAFLPISERPLDHWTKSFFRAIFTPTKRTWQSSLLTIDNPAFQNRLSLYLAKYTLQNQGSASQVAIKSSVISRYVINPPQAALPATPIKNDKSVEAIEPQKQAIVPPTKDIKPAPPMPSPQEINQTVELAKQAQLAQTKMVEAAKVVNAIKAQATAPGANPALFTEKLKDAIAKLVSLQQETGRIAHDLAVLSKTPVIFEKKRPPILIKPVSINLVLTTTPNIINGIVTDSQGNYLEGVIIVTHDKQGLPVRALKTNKLGQFLAATPLPNGVYIISLEKDKLGFDELEIKLEGQVIPPIRVSAKKGEVI